MPWTSRHSSGVNPASFPCLTRQRMRSFSDVMSAHLRLPVDVDTDVVPDDAELDPVELLTNPLEMTLIPGDASAPLSSNGDVAGGFPELLEPVGMTRSALI